MNVSGIVVKTAPEHIEDVMVAVEAGGLGEVHFHDSTGKIIVTIEGEGAGEEVSKMRKIMDLPHVLGAELAYSYSEDDLNRSREKIDRPGSAVPEDLIS
jgi:nitrate reductase NapD